MASIKICDLCRKRIDSWDELDSYRIQRKVIRFAITPFWEEIDAHKACVKKLMDAKKEAGHDALQ